MLTFKPAAGSYVLYSDGIHECVYLIVNYRNMGIANLYDINTGDSNCIIIDFSTKYHIEYNKNLTVIG